MADRNIKNPGNVPGPFYVDQCCIICDACRTTAPDNFQSDDDGLFYFVAKQPENETEYQLCVDALAGCPHEAIGEDGDAEPPPTPLIEARKE